MKTQTLKTELINKENAETTILPIMAAETGELLQFTTSNQTSKKSLLLQTVEFGEVGFERKSDWMRLVNKLNNYDETPIKRMITGDKKSLDWGGMKASREDIKYTEDGFLIEFKEPVKVIIEEIGENYLTVEVTQLKGKITWEWFFRGNCKELENYANGLDIFIYDVEIVK